MNTKNIKTVAVIGAGIMGEGIAQNFAQAGLSVRIVDQEKDILDRCLHQIGANLNLFLEFNLLHEDPSRIRARIEPFLTGDLAAAVEGCEFIVEALPEVLDLKKVLLSQLDSFNPEAILGSNTSSLTISQIAEGARYPGRVIGTHYFNPAHIMPLVELHKGKETRDEVMETTKALMLRAGKMPVIVRKEVPGFIVNRIQGAMEREIDYLIDEGIVTPEDLDVAAKASYGFRLACMGPMETEDMIGLDTALRVSGRIYKTLSDKTTPSPTLAAKVEKGELGLKSGMGWYDYRDRTQEQVKEGINRKLLEQLALLISRRGKDTRG
jgi:3-hydroxybutyryl-CoA dehydrogenase